jgi:hypothetical protein
MRARDVACKHTLAVSYSYHLPYRLFTELLNLTSLSILYKAIQFSNITYNIFYSFLILDIKENTSKLLYLYCTWETGSNSGYGRMEKLDFLICSKLVIKK